MHIIIFACLYPLSRCIYTALVSLIFSTVITISLNNFMFLLVPLFFFVYSLANNKEMAFNFVEYIAASLVPEEPYKDSIGERQHL